MATRKGTIALNADFTQLASAVGAIQGMSTTVKTDRFLSPLVEAAHVNLANQFDIHMDVLAQSQPSRYHHVYEWRMLGAPGGRLWTHQLKGRGSSNRYASWAWKASKTPILTPTERASNPDDPMSDLSDEKVASFNERDYFFQWKAPVMEYNVATTIRPRYANQIAFPSAVKPGKIIGMGQAIVTNPGGPGTTLAFTTEWTRWWGKVAPTVFDQTLAEEMKNGIENATIAAVKRGSRKATVGVHTMSEKAAVAQGKKWARDNLHKFANSKAQEADWYDPEEGL